MRNCPAVLGPVKPLRLAAIRSDSTMSDVYSDKAGSLCLALENEESRTGAADAIRALVEAIVLEPHGERLNITLKGNLAGMLSAARDSKRSPDTGDLLVQIKMVARARNQRYLQLWSGAA